MKRKLAGILMCVLPLVGCNNDVQKPDAHEKQGTREIVVQTKNGPVVMKNLNRNDDRKETTATVEGAGFSGILQIGSAGDGVVTVGGNARLIDASGRLLYSIEMTVNQETNEVAYRQATEHDYVAWSVFETDERVRESYDANGDRASFEYPQLPEETKARTINHVEHHLPTAHLPASVREYAAQAEAYRAWYLPHENSSLNNNEAGDLLVQLLSSPDVSYALIGDQPEQMTRFQAGLCSLLNSCATFICRILPGTSLCSACTGGAFACAIFQIIAPWIWGTP